MSNNTLLIARHGNTFASGDVVTRVGKTDLPLVESGLEQGRAIGRYLKSAGLMPDVIFTSRLRRTIQTAEQVQAAMETDLPMEPLTMFDEIDYGPDENQPEEKVIERLGKAALLAWDEEAKVPEGWKVSPKAIIEHWRSFAADMLRSYAGKRILVVTSNGIARFAPHLTGDFEYFRSIHSLKVGTGRLCIFEHQGDAWICREWNLKP